MMLGSLSNDYGDGNENGKKAIGFDWQNNNFARAARLLDISRFMEDVNARRQFFFFFF